MTWAEKEVCLSELRRESRTGPGNHTSQFPYIGSLRILKSGVQLETLGKLISNFCNGQFVQYWNCKLRPQKARGSQLSRISVKLTSPLSSALAKLLDNLPRKQKLEHMSVFLLDSLLAKDTMQTFRESLEKRKIVSPFPLTALIGVFARK